MVDSIARGMWCVAFVLSMALVGCSSDEPGNSSSSLEVVQEDFRATSRADGVVSFSFAPAAGASAFQLTAQTASGSFELQSLRSPSGQELKNLSTESTRTGSQSPSPHVVSFPFLSAPVTSGTYVATYRVLNASGGGSLANAGVTLSVISKRDADRENGVLRVNLLLIGPVANDRNIRDALEEAVTIWRSIQGRGGIELDVAWYELPGERRIPNPALGSVYFESIGSQVRPDAVNIFLASEVEGLREPMNTYGFSGGQPGTALPGPRSAVAISVLAITGRDGAFDLPDEQDGVEEHNDETRLAAEELARLTSQYLGVENIVTVEGSRVTGGDSLSDTPSCVALIGCREEGAVRENFMFPFPLREADNTDEYYPRQFVTSQQRAVMNNHVLVE